jgi:hypothetical protein
MISTAPPREAGSWWAHRRWSFSLTVLVGYAVTIVFSDGWTPWSAGHHIGLSFGAVAFYAVGGALWTGVANIVYSIGPFGERFVGAGNVPTYRKCAHVTLTAVGAMSTVLWYAEWMLEAWSRR